MGSGEQYKVQKLQEARPVIAYISPIEFRWFLLTTVREFRSKCGLYFHREHSFPTTKPMIIVTMSLLRYLHFTSLTGYVLDPDQGYK